MIILCLRTDKPEAELYLYDDTREIDSHKWLAHRALSDTLLTQIKKLLANNKLAAIDGLVAFEGPGSFTGLRIGLTVANTLSYSWQIPIVAARDDDWLLSGVRRILDGENDHQIIPYYASEAHITQPRK